MRKNVFKAIADAVAAVPGVAFVDLWNNQVQTLNGGKAFALPAVFVEFEAVEWKQQNMGARRGALAVRLHVVTRAVATNLNGGKAFALPAVFVEFEAVEWKQQNMGARRGALAVRLHVVTRAVATNGHKDPRINEALAVFDLLDTINAAMQGLRGENFSGFMLTTSATNHDHAEIVENVERYVCGVQDLTARRPVRAVSGLSVAISKTD